MKSQPARADLKQVVGFAGIANPEGFRKTILGMGLSIVDFIAFPDHKVFSADDIRSLKQRYSGIPLVCTEKDQVKLNKLSPEILKDIYYIRTNLRVSPQDAFMVQITRNLNRL